ncbi:helicase domino-like isoform X2 [Tubulanus polymorphus]|uniref:helicase domino-like isoform X2 n=1 Tax=Tubulanus polymorphus TaxID=672921 RepID=UPI003DA6A2C8
MQRDLSDGLKKQRVRVGELPQNQQGQPSPLALQQQQQSPSLQVQQPGSSLQQPGLSLQHYFISGSLQNISLQPATTAATSIIGALAAVPSTSIAVTNVSAAAAASSKTTSISATGGTIHHHGLNTQQQQHSPQTHQQLISSQTHQQIMSSQTHQQLVSSQNSPQLLSSQTHQQLMSSPIIQLDTASNQSQQTVKPPVRINISSTGAGSVLTPGVRTMNLSPRSSPVVPRKKIKLEIKPPASEEIGNYRKKITDLNELDLNVLREKYVEHLTELFFLQHGGNFMDYIQWKKRPTAQLQAFLKSGSLDSEEESVEEETKETRINDEVKVITSSGSSTPIGTPVAISTTLPPAVSAISQQATVQVSAVSQMSTQNSPSNSIHDKTALVKTLTAPLPQTPTASSNQKIISSSSSVLVTPGVSCVNKTSPPKGHSASGAAAAAASSQRQHTRQHSISAVYDTAIGSQEAIVERAKQEAQVIQRVSELRKDGLWSTRRLPKVQEAPRNKAHWDYLLEEMHWLAADFAQERKWKKAGCRKIARMVNRYHQERQQKELKAEKEEMQKIKRIASNMAKMVKEFWTNIEKVVEYKQKSRLDERRKKAMDMHLNFIVDQTEKYSSWLTEGLKVNTSSRTSSVTGASNVSSPSHSSVKADDDDEFDPEGNDEDDEETIALEESEVALNADEQQRELDALQKDSEMPIEDLLNSLPQEIIDKPASIKQDDSDDDSDTVQHEQEMKSDNDFSADEGSTDDEATLEQEEKIEPVKESDHKQELADLEAEKDLTMEELIAKYGGAYDSDFEMPETPSETENEDDTDDDDGDDDDEVEEDEEEPTEEESSTTDVAETTEEVGVDYLLKDENIASTKSKEDESGPSQQITDIAATAQSLQPTGYTLETTQVSTPVPFLLKHTLREYQHVGLDWLATLYEKKLNGILADEMGLGKTIQTIALLAHLACEKGVWGPHLIVVPTSVMLNWEMELKKWCPGFKILTYYGSQKERKQKRTGWTKTNAFHVCITSYKLVIQDHQSFRRKKWKYFILDEAQNIKNFKSQRWQTLLNFQSQRRLLLTGTPLQNSLMELWSLMHFLMPHVFQSHRDFKEWFASPLTGMIEGSQEYNENLIRRLHKVLRPFLLRRLKADVEKQMPKKYEHVVMCRLSKRQRFLYDDFMSQTRTKETLATGHFMSVINILMQLRKVCNHPNLFDPRPTVSPFQTDAICFYTASIVLRALEKNPFDHIDLCSLYPCIADVELSLPAFAAHRIKKLQSPKRLIVEIDEQPLPAPRPKPVALKSFLMKNLAPPTAMPTTAGRASPLVQRSVTHQQQQLQQQQQPAAVNKIPIARSPVPRLISTPTTLMPVQRSVTLPTVNSVPVLNSSVSDTISANPTAKFMASPQQSGLAILQSSVATTTAASQPITVQIHHTQQGTRLMIPSGQLAQLPAGFIQILQTSSGQQIITTPVQQSTVVQPITQVSSVTAPPPVLQTPTSSQPTIAVVNGLAPHSVVSGTVSGVNAVRPSQPIQLPTSSTIAVTSTNRPIALVQPVSTTANSTLLNRHSPSPSPLKRPFSPAISRASPVTLAVTQNPTVAAAPAIQVQAWPKPTVKPSSVQPQQPSASTVKQQPKPKIKKEKSIFHIDSLENRKTQYKTLLRERIVKYNRRRCDVRPVYGQDLCSAVSIFNNRTGSADRTGSVSAAWNGYIHCYNAQILDRNSPTAVTRSLWKRTDALSSIVKTPEQYLREMAIVLDNYTFVVPPVASPRITLHTSHPSPSLVQSQRFVAHRLHENLAPKSACLHRVESRMTVQFPELRLIQYDCGKLQTMDLLLRRLKSGYHRVLIFTQMTRMLDVLESFLNYHGHRYLRLDGTTKVEQRQLLMDRFNADKRIFCMILSTRSGGIGVNLTGADTVIFYDSDWNPTMDAQAQDRCHRIGQTRDVHIYRLISERTIEENILKKANQKRLLGDVAIEGGNFTTAFFRKNTLSELFAEPSGLEALAREKERLESPRVSQTRASPAPRASPASARASPALSTPARASPVPVVQQGDLEQALTNAEDETDVQAAKTAKAEQCAELAEFDESIPWDEKEAERKEEEISKVEQELALLDKELTPVERYAVTFLEEEMEPSEEMENVEEQIIDIKKEWELARLKEMKEEEERRAALEEDDMLFTYSHSTASQPFINDLDGEHMPLWAPPTPPKDDNDIYIDHTQSFLFEINTMPESELPPIYVKKEHKRIKLDPAVKLDPAAGPIDSYLARKQKVRKEEQPRVPRSLFDRPSAALLKMRRDAKMQKLRQGLVKPSGLTTSSANGSSSSKPLQPLNKPLVDISSDQPEWLIHEDWALLQAIQTLLNLPLNLTVISPAHIPNWDIIADVVNAGSRTYRSAKQCKNRYETVIVPREEGKILYDVNPRKQKKSKGVYKWMLSPFQNKTNRPMKTSQLFAQDNNLSITSLHTMRFDSAKSISSKRVPTLRPTLASPIQKNPKHAEVLAESGITYDQPKTPVQVAADRAERIAKEKKQSQAAQERAAQQPTLVKATGAAIGQTATQLVPTSIPAVVQTGSLQKSALGTGVAVSLARGVTGPGGIVVNTPGGVTPTPFAAINKRISQTVGVTPHATKPTLARNLLQGVGDKKGAQTVSALLQSSAGNVTANIAAAAAARARTTTAMTVQDISAVSQTRTVPAGATVITNTNLTPTQLAQRTGTAVTITAASTTGTVAQQLAAGTTTKNLTAAQLNALRQQAMKHQAALLTQQQFRQAQRIQLKQQQMKRLQTQGTVQQAVTTATALPKTVAVSSPLLTGLAQTHVVTAATAQRLQVQGQKTTAVKQSIPRTLTHEELIALCKRNQPQKTGQAAQIIAQQVQQQMASGTVLKTVSAPSSSVPSVTIPVSTVNVGGVNINVSVPQQKTTTGKLTTITQQQQQHLRQLQLQQQKVTTLTHAQVQQVAAGKAQLGAVQIIQQPQKTLPTTVTVQQFQQIVKQQQQQQQQQQQGQQTIQQIITSMTPHTTSTPTTVLVTQSPQTVTSRLTAPSGGVSQIRPIRHLTALTATTTTPVHTILSTLASGTSVTSTTSSHTVTASVGNTGAGSGNTAQAVKIGDQIVITQTKPASAPIVATVTIPSAPISPVVQTLSLVTAAPSPKPLTVASISRPQTPNIAITNTTAVAATITPTATIVTATPSGQLQKTGAGDGTSSILIQQTPAAAAAAGDQSTQQKTPYTMRLRNPPKQHQ